ncbi:hypothetical protein IB633_03805 [Francisella philomiragia]|uniref:Uncharacterized protein n=1 Tax=Francisella philomiragia subsp. philomiragia (strain ATCC 25017 / CCUG 19701 / FSC 153 / O\|nr:hypothetical protein [Francisella philomiragia]AJI47497.1 hypothetical protein BF30_1004 [Francisella philomiragia]AJI48997.1 hypothetical protein KU46_551 [Francisella philomiragia]MBK2020521.1 hypothetical protein [Francisella philomiragia]MBK2030214.1 hypothetical protein [Francisella philomiragia]MBK2264824.1 hypothetical protein [Francisella philomiragia]
MKKILIKTVLTLTTFTTVFANMELHTVWIGDKKLKVNDLNQMKDISDKNPHITQFVWMDRSPNEIEKDKLEQAKAHAMHIKILYSRSSQIENKEDKENIDLLIGLAQLEANTKYGKAYASNIIKELVLYFGGSEKNDKEYTMVKDMGARFVDNEVPNLETDQNLAELLNNWGYLTHRMKTPILLSRKGVSGIYTSKDINSDSINVKNSIINSYANADWGRLFDASNTIDESYTDNPIHGIYEPVDASFEDKKYDNNMLLLKASENIRKREIWSIKNAQYSHQDPKYTFTRFKEEVKDIKPKINNKGLEESLEESDKFLNKNTIEEKIKLTADTAYTGAIAVSHSHSLCHKAWLNYDEYEVENNRNLSWVPESSASKKRSNSIDNSRNNRSIEKYKLDNFKTREFT